jgi:4-amino-4-deoxy-L-arabinose transferase-like glycosyltransferase
MDRWFRTLNTDKPFIIKLENRLNIIKNHTGLIIICLIAVVLHVNPIVTRPILIIGDESLHLYGGLWIFNIVNSSSLKYFQLVFWILTGFTVFLVARDNVRNYITKKLSEYMAGGQQKGFFIVIVFLTAVMYYYFLHEGQFNLDLRYTPLSRLLYLVSYMPFGISPLLPRCIELTFYILTAVYIYRIIGLFNNRNAALLGASFYLFFPVTFIYANLAELACSTIFFIVLISYHYLRFLQKKDDRDIIMVSFFIGAGFLYKQPVLLMFFICTAYLVYCRLMDRNLNVLKYIRIMSLSLVPVVPWMIIQRYFAWRQYRIILTNLIPPDGMGYSHFMHLPIETTWVVFTLFIISIFFLLKCERNNLVLFSLLIFIAYYIFLALDQLSVSPRMLMVFCPTIAIFTALFLSSIINKVRWKYSFNSVLVILSSYLILINTAPSLNAAFL